MAAMAGFAAGFCSNVVNKHIHRIFTGSAMVLYMFHRLIEACLMKFYASGIWFNYKNGDVERNQLGWYVFWPNFFICFGIFFILNTNKYTRKLAGIDEAQ